MKAARAKGWNPVPQQPGLLKQSSPKNSTVAFVRDILDSAASEDDVAAELQSLRGC